MALSMSYTKYSPEKRRIMGKAITSLAPAPSRQLNLDHFVFTVDKEKVYKKDNARIGASCRPDSLKT